MFMSQEEFPIDGSSQNNNNQDVQKNLDLKNQQISQLSSQLKEYETELQNVFEQLHTETSKRKEIEDRFNQVNQNNNQQNVEQIKLLLREREPNLEVLMELTMKKEREQQEKKDAKVLEILKIKDKQIQDLQQKSVSQETDYGNLAQSYQESKKRIRFLEDEAEKNNEIIRQLHAQLETLQNKFISVQSNQHYQKIEQLEEQLQENQQYINKLQDENNELKQYMDDQTQKESYFQEIINRMRDQLNQKDDKYQNLEINLQNEIEKRIREEKQVEKLMHQINQINQENINERSINIDKIKQDKEMIDNVNKLQNEKYQLINDVDALRKIISQNDDRLRIVLDRISQIRGFGFNSTLNFGHNSNLIDLIERKLEDVARVLKEMEDDNLDLTQKIKKQSELLNSRESELEQIILENEELSMKINVKKKNAGNQTQIDKIVNEEKINDKQQKIQILEEKNDKIEEQLQQYKDKYKQIQGELENANQELSYHIKKQQSRKHSPSTQSAITQYGGNKQEQEEIISRLNAKLTNMKFNEEKLTSELQQLKSQLQSQHLISSSIKSSSLHSQFDNQFDTQKLISFEERLSEYEFIILDQRQKLIHLEQHNYDLLQKLKDQEFDKQKENENLLQRIKRLTEINNKYEQINVQQTLQNQEIYSVGGGQQSKFLSEEGGGTYSQSTKSTAAQTERMRQIAQQLELNNLALKHDLDEQRIIKEQMRNECEQLKNEINQKNKELSVVKQTYKLANINFDFNIESKFIAKIENLKQKIQELEQIIDQQSRGSNGINKQADFEKQMQFIDKNSWTGHRIEDLYKTNENLRNENQQFILALQEVKEEYTTKITDFSDKYELDRQKMKNENISLQRKLETLQSQLQYMEKKEIRLFGQLEESKQNQMQEAEEKEKRTVELEELLFKKEEIINELEREIKQKDKSLQERQEQIAVLIDTLENEHSNDQLRQKVLNLSAELCSLKAIEAQQERKSNELFHQLKKVEMQNQKTKKHQELEKQKSQDQLKQIQILQQEIDEFNKQVQELQNQLDVSQRECSENKYKLERESFQIKLKEESISQLKDQIRRQEQAFKEEIDKIKKDFIYKVTKINENNEEINIVQSISFKQCLNHLNLILSDLFEQGHQQQEHQIIQELEKSLIIASQNIEKLQDLLYKEKKINSKLQNDYKSQTHNKILICQLETQIQKSQSLQSLIISREEDKQKFLKEREIKYQKIIREQDSKISSLHKELHQIQSQFDVGSQETLQLNEQKEIIEQELYQFQQESQNQKQSMEKQAELQVEERFKAKYEQIKMYFDSQITKILLSQGNSDKVMELGREICALKIVINKLEQKLMCEQSEKEASQINTQYFKEINQQIQQKVRDIQTKNNQLQQKGQNQSTIIKLELEKRKNENILLEKEILKCKDQIEQLQRELLKQEELNIQKIDDKFLKQNLLTQKNDEDVQLYQEKITELNQFIQNLQDKIIDLRTQHIQEFEDLKTQYDLDLSDAKRELLKEKQFLEKKFNPSQNPDDLVEQNEKLRQKIIELRNQYESIQQENIIVRKKLEQEKLQVEQQKNSIFVHKKVLADLETTLMEGSTHQYTQNQSNNNGQITQMQQFQKQKPEEQKRKSNGQKSSKNNKTQLHFNKDIQFSEDQQSHSKIIQQDSSSLDVSALTSMNQINLRNSNYMTQAQNSSNTNKQFTINPPQIIKALIHSKINEVSYQKQIQDCIQKENHLRDSYKNLLIEQQNNINNQQNQNKGQDNGIDNLESLQHIEYQKRMIELQIENEELKSLKNQTIINELQLKQQENAQDFKNIQYPQQDCNLLIECILLLSNQLATLEVISNSQKNLMDNPPFSNDNEIIEQSQRLVIKSLTNIINNGRGSIDLKYLPTQESDRKIWYLELLEQQIDNSDSLIKNLQSFIKKLSIEISGNLQSAAQIKAASMELAQNTKQTSDQILVMRQVLGLIKHDLMSLKKTQISTSINNNINNEQPNAYNKTITINPFSNNINQNTLSFQGIQNEQLIQNIESLQNQLTLTDKVKKTIESDLVSLKMVHAKELSLLQHQFTQIRDQRDTLLQTNEELNSKVNNLDTALETLKKEIQNTNQQSQFNMQILLEKEREKEALSKNKITTQKHLTKLQQDLHEWRKQSEENMALKDKQIQELNQQQQNLSKERDRLKSENQMLRQNEKQKMKGQNEDIQRLQQENKEMQEQINRQILERKNEIEYWVTERATMRDMIDQLEIDRADNKINNNDKIDIIQSKEKSEGNFNNEKLKQIKKKTHKKIKQKEIEIKNKDKELQSLKDELLRLKLSTSSLEFKIRDAFSKCSESDERVKYFQQKFKESELEKELLLAEKNNAISSNDISALQIQQELNSLRECFAKLKVERDNLLYEMESIQMRDKEWKQTVDRLNEEMQNMEKHLIGREKEASTQVKILEAKQSALIQDVKYLKQENERMKNRVKEQEVQEGENQKNMHQYEMTNQQYKFQYDEVIRQITEQQRIIEEKEQRNKEVQEQLILNEGIKFKEIEELRNKLNEVKEANAQIIVLYENQLEFLRSKLSQDKKSDQKLDQLFSLAQRESVIKSLKKEVSSLKLQLTKQKSKLKDLKLFLNNQENLYISQNKTSQQQQPSRNQNKSQQYSKGAQKQQQLQQEDQILIDKQTSKVAKFLMNEGGVRELMQQMQKQNKQILKMVQIEADLSKSENWNIVLSTQLQQQQENNNQLQNEVEQLQKKMQKEQKSVKQSQNNNQEIKALQQEIEQIKQEWMPPLEANQLQQQKEQLSEQVKEQSQQIKTLKDELQRKREVLQQLKQQREQTEVEATQILQDMEGLKDDNVKLQKLIKDNVKNQQSMKELKQKNEFLKNQEKIIKDELNQLNDKLKINKIDIQRKEQLIKEFNNKISQMQEDVNLTRELQNELDKYKELIKKMKIEIEIKENQVKSLKQRLEITDNELDQVKTQNMSSIQNSQLSQKQIESQVKTAKNKLKKYENYLKKSLEALRKIGLELTNKQGQINIKEKRRSQKSQKSDNPMIISELDKDMYKDSVNILGVSIDELEEFMNPSNNNNNQSITMSKSQNQTFMAKLDQVCGEIPETLNQDLDQICNYCMKLINDLNPDINFL